MECQINCLYGFDRDSDGCKTCKCRNPCSDVKCLQGSVCVMSAVDCYQKENCPPQPRCVLNLCPIGAAALSPIGVTETCSVDSQCPKDYWCHNVGCQESQGKLIVTISDGYLVRRSVLPPSLSSCPSQCLPPLPSTAGD